MKQPTCTLTATAPTATLAFADGYIVILEENGDSLLLEDGSPFTLESFASKVAVSVSAPSVAVVLRRNA